MYTGNYECLELFVKPEAGKKGSVSLKKVKENKTEIKELQHIYGNILIQIPLLFLKIHPHFSLY